ncbi:MAG: hypothetical protein LBG57_06765, partial [Treponema sp.]|nr:hypothetical protein [Treponema sp.]
GDQTYTWYQGEYYPDVLTNGTPYTFTVTTRDINGNLGAAVTIGSTPPHEGTLAQRIAAASSGDTITLYKDEAIPAAIGINKTITLVGYDSEKTLELVQNGNMFNVTAGGGLTLTYDVTLKGKSGNNASLVQANSGGTLVMESGSKLSGNIHSSGYGGGVEMAVGATVTMNGGEISGNESARGSGVFMYGGTFTVNNGTISGNKAQFGAGVFMNSGTFTMKGGEISGNTADLGGGVHVGMGNGTFKKESGGTIYGSNEADSTLRNTAGSGHAVYHQSGRYRNTTLGPSDDISTASLTSPPWNQ